MSVIAMKVKSVQDHPDADALKIYQFMSPKHDELQIVANLENVYEVDDLVYVALEGALLKDGTGIKASKLRGVRSYGMAIGKVEEPNIEPGDDFTDEFCQESISGDAKVIKWVDIESCFNIRRYLKQQDLYPKVSYALKVKVDGTNGAVQLTGDGVFAQSRSRVITPSDDNMGFALWVNNNIDYFKSISIENSVVTIFGEFCGKGIQKRTAISQIDRRVFAVFAIQYGGRDGHEAEFEIEPERISNVLPKHPDIFVLPWMKERIVLDFANVLDLEKVVEDLNKVVLDVETCDPWVKDTFGIEGMGEGIVAYPIMEGGARVSRETYKEYVFKAKGEKHQVVKVKKPVQLDPEVAKSMNEFVALFVTDNRLQQGVTVACDGEFEMRHTGKFLKWFGQDVQKESVAELEAAELEWKQVAKLITRAAGSWYKGRCQSI